MKHLFAYLDAALFDLDGTLVETNIDFPRMRREMVRLAVGYGLAADEIAKFDILGIVDRVVEDVGARHGEFEAATARDEAFAILEEIELRHSADAREIRPARELVEALQERKIRVGIVTRNCRAASEESLARAGIPSDVLLCRDDVARTKPNPDHLLLALARLSSRPDRSVMVGDHLMDMTAGKRAGMLTIGLLTNGRPTDYFKVAEPDAVARDLSEILCAVVDCHS